MGDRLSRPVQVGLYGAGAFGRFVARALAGSLKVRISAVASRSSERAEALSRAEGIPRVHPSYASLVGDPSLELILLVTPPFEHAKQAREALAAGRHVLVEKPLATTFDDGAQLVAEAAARHLVLAVDYPMLYNPLIEALMLFNSSRLVGPLRRIAVDNIASNHGLNDGHWFWDRTLSGGIFVEHGVHFFDWCGRLAGSAERVVALAHTSGTREDQVAALIQHESGAIASHFHAFVASPETERTRVVVSYESVDVILDGWIPTRMHLTGRSAGLGTTTIRRMLRRTVESIPDQRLGFYFEAGDKEALYAEGIRAAAEDVAMALHDATHHARNSGAAALPSLQLACAAREAAQSGHAVALTSGLSL